MRPLRTMGALTILLSLVIPRIALGQSCSVTFETATVKPSILDSLMTVLKSFNPKGEAQRLTSLRQQVQQLKEDKRQLSDTLNNVLQQNSMPSWLEARVKQIPDIQSKVLTLLEDLRSEADHGGLFAGDKSFSDLEELIDKKKRDMSKICVLTQQPLPLVDPALKQQLQSVVSNLNLEVESLGKVDDQIGTLIQKAHEQETAATAKEKKN
jgi:hypothetical protein